MIKSMSTQHAYEAGFRVKPRAYDLLRIYSPHAFVGSAGRNVQELESLNYKQGKGGMKHVL